MGIAVIMQKTPNKLPVISTAVAPQKVFWRDKVRQQASISQLETAGVQYRTGLKTNVKVSIVTCAWRGCVCVCVYACVHVCMCVDAVFACRVQPWVPWLVLWRTATVSSMTWTPRWEAWSHPCTKPWRTWFLLWMQMLLPSVSTWWVSECRHCEYCSKLWWTLIPFMDADAAAFREYMVSQWVQALRVLYKAVVDLWVLYKSMKDLIPFVDAGAAAFHWFQWGHGESLNPCMIQSKGRT